MSWSNPYRTSCCTMANTDGSLRCNSDVWLDDHRFVDSRCCHWSVFSPFIAMACLSMIPGGKIKPAGTSKVLYGSWNPNAIFIVWTLSGISYGMVELIRRVIPADIVGGHVGKLRRMDATVVRFFRPCHSSSRYLR